MPQSQVCAEFIEDLLAWLRVSGIGVTGNERGPATPDVPC
jgi:hypothetical protein